MSGYIGTQPVPQATQTRDSFTATSGQTSFATGGYTPNFLDVYLNGVKLAAADYTASNGSDVVLASGAATGDILEVVAFTTFNSASSSIDDNGNATALTIDSSENVGIGTSNPTAKFSVAGSTSGDYLAKIESTNQFGLKIKTTSTSNSHEQLAIHDGNNDVKFMVMGGGNVHATAINLGGTGAANRLDDYEEGTFTPSFQSGTFTYSKQLGYYTKIGNLVTISMTIGWSSRSGNGGLTVQNIPFTPLSDSNQYRSGASLGTISGLPKADVYQVTVGLDGGTSSVFLRHLRNNATWGGFDVSAISSTGAVQITATYQTE